MAQAAVICSEKKELEGVLLSLIESVSGGGKVHVEDEVGDTAGPSTFAEQSRVEGYYKNVGNKRLHDSSVDVATIFGE